MNPKVCSALAVLLLLAGCSGQGEDAGEMESFRGVVQQAEGSTILVEVDMDEAERKTSDLISVSLPSSQAECNPFPPEIRWKSPTTV